MTLLRERGFRNFWLATSVSLLGDEIAVLAVPLVAVLVLDAGAGQMGLLTAAALLPHLLFSLPAGVWLDRVASRRRVMIACDLGRAALVGTVPLAYALDVLTLAQLYAVAFLAGSLSVLFDLSYPTLFVSLASRDRYIEGNSLVHGSRSFSPPWPARRSAACSSRRSARRWRCSATRSRSSCRRSSSGGCAPRSRRSSTTTSPACAHASRRGFGSSDGIRSSGRP